MLFCYQIYYAGILPHIWRHNSAALKHRTQIRNRGITQTSHVGEEGAPAPFSLSFPFPFPFPPFPPHPSSFPPLSSLFPIPLFPSQTFSSSLRGRPLIAARESGISPIGYGRSPAAKGYLVKFQAKNIASSSHDLQEFFGNKGTGWPNGGHVRQVPQWYESHDASDRNITVMRRLLKLHTFRYSRYSHQSQSIISVIFHSRHKTNHFPTPSSPAFTEF